ncbi:MAG: hypothetical protein ACXIUB_02810 [Wenzhouxiangella sp.]
MNKNQVAIVAVFLVFGVPVLLATLLHTTWFDWRPDGTRNHGELISPVIPLPVFSLAMPDGQPLEHSDLLDRWQLVHVRDGQCLEDCLEHLYWLRQVRAAQDRHQPDIGLVLISTAELTDETLAQIALLATDFRVLHGADGQYLSSYFPQPSDAQASYILDPMANIILAYEDGADPNGIRRDLRRLLTWTRRD